MNKCPFEAKFATLKIVHPICWLTTDEWGYLGAGEINVIKYEFVPFSGRTSVTYEVIRSWGAIEDVLEENVFGTEQEAEEQCKSRNALNELAGRESLN